MPRRVPVDQIALSELLRPGASVATHSELRQVGVPSSTITLRIRREGPWQRALPGVVVGHRGVLTLHERRLAALKYAGGGSALTGLDALDLLGVRARGLRRSDRVHVLVPHASQKTSHGFALVTRTRRDVGDRVRDGLRVVPPARAVIDACRRLDDLDEVRELVAAVVQQRFCTAAEVWTEVRLAQRQRTALSREVLAEVAAGIRSVAEARLRAGFDRYGVPQPRWNAEVRDEGGQLLVVYDAYWEDLHAELEINSVEWHLAPGDFRETTRRQRSVVLSGLRTISVLPSEVEDDLEAVCREVLQFLRMCAAEQGRAAS
ncbi:hypothetical protein FHN55_09980 [Streptomyces sp. NP160]|uniref:hypothetical protein n=1 Tax=Streptomyces sp. NP160 TaxID=2586637 RepID=UPI0011197292|nr:hypothetical protein [Streptomyces sp. NP160]TNM67732.1 hypothetical protein FHN55_09980 [Streptomyces sp. NP160]